MSDCRYEGKFIGQVEAVPTVGHFGGAAPHVSGGPTATDCIEHHRCPVDRPARGPSMLMFAVAIRGVRGRCFGVVSDRQADGAAGRV